METTTPPKVYAAINAVQGALAKAGIGKNNQTTGYASFKFRGIDDVYNSIAPLLSEFGLVIIPRVIDRITEHRVTKSGGTLYYVSLHVEFDFIATDDGTKHTASVWGEAMDNGDKAANKAMSAAYKYVCLQAFCIPTEGDNDADGTTHAPTKVVKPASNAMVHNAVGKIQAGEYKTLEGVLSRFAEYSMSVSPEQKATLKTAFDELAIKGA